MIEKLKNIPFISYNPSYEFLAFYRIFFSLFLLWNGVSNESWMCGIPSTAMHPPISFLSFAETIPPKWFFYGCYYLQYICLLLILIGFRPKIFAILYMVTAIISDNYAYSFGKVNHDFLYTLPILVMAFSPWNTTYSFFKEAKKEKDILSKSWPMFLLSMFFGFGMFTAGFAKFLGGWLNMDFHYTQVFFYQYRYGIGWDSLLSDTFNRINSSFFWEFLDYSTVIFESVFIIAFLKPKFFRFMILVTLFFHINVLLMLNISFTYALGFYALFIPVCLLPEGVKIKVKNFLQTLFYPKYKYFALGFVILFMLLVVIFNFNIIGFIIGKFFELFPFDYSYPILALGGAFLMGIYLFIRSFKKQDIC